MKLERTATIARDKDSQLFQTAAFLPGQRLVVAGEQVKAVHVYGADGALQKKLKHAAGVVFSAVSADGQRLAVGPKGACLSLESGETLWKIAGDVNHLAFSSSGVLAVGVGAEVRLCDAAGAVVGKWKLPKQTLLDEPNQATVTGLVWLDAERLLVVGQHITFAPRTRWWPCPLFVATAGAKALQPTSLVYGGQTLVHAVPGGRHVLVERSENGVVWHAANDVSRYDLVDAATLTVRASLELAKDAGRVVAVVDDDRFLTQVQNGDGTCLTRVGSFRRGGFDVVDTDLALQKGVTGGDGRLAFVRHEQVDLARLAP